MEEGQLLGFPTESNISEHTTNGVRLPVRMTFDPPPSACIQYRRVEGSEGWAAGAQIFHLEELRLRQADADGAFK